MGWYRRPKLAFDAFHTFASSFKSKNPIRNPTPRTNPTKSGLILGLTRHNPVPRPSGVESGSKHRNLNYFAGRPQTHQTRPRKWYRNPRTVITVVLVGSGVIITVYFGHLETVPYTKRKHFVLISRDLEKRIGEAQFEKIKKAFKGKILPAIHPDSIRVQVIATDIVQALQRGLMTEQKWGDIGYASPEIDGSVDDPNGLGVLVALSEDRRGRWFDEDEDVDEGWVERSREKGRKSGYGADTGHLDGYNWEVLVVNDPVVNAFCLPGGKIVVFTGLLEHFRADAEIATILGHEVGHAVARHAAEMITKNLWFTILQLVLFQYIMPDVVYAMSTLFLRLPFSRRMEMEADYIGLLLMASAGYDPRVAPKVYEKLGQVTGDSPLRDYLSTHPSGKTRAQMLAKAEVMKQAMALYREALTGKMVQGFL